jgi:hypothetical protein
MEKRFLALLELTLLIRCCLAIILGSKAVKYDCPNQVIPTVAWNLKQIPGCHSQLKMATIFPNKSKLEFEISNL